MTGNSFGNILKITTWGESHGTAIGAVLDGVPPNLLLDAEQDIQPFLNLRKPGANSLVTKRQEEDQIQILSGVFEGKTLGTPISLIIYNQDQNSKDYSNIKDKFRPGHGDIGYFYKYGIYDYRGGGRGSARETAMRVAAGAIARKIIANISFHTEIIEIGGVKANSNNLNNELHPIFRTYDYDSATKWEELINDAKAQGDSLGGKIKIIAKNVPKGLGNPVFNKLDAEIAKAMMSIPAVKAVAIGDGLESSYMSGSSYNDQITAEASQAKFLSNHAGGILGGISTGQDIEVTIIVKPTSSIAKLQQTVDVNSNSTEINIIGRHDPCVALRAWIIAESMLAIILADYYLIDQTLINFR